MSIAIKLLTVMIGHYVTVPPAASISVVACHSNKVSLLFDQAEKAPSLKIIIKIDGSITEAERQRSTESGLSLYTMEEVEVCLALSCGTLVVSEIQSLL